MCGDVPVPHLRRFVFACVQMFLVSVIILNTTLRRFLMIKTVVEKREVEVCDECGCDAKYIRVRSNGGRNYRNLCLLREGEQN